MRNTTLGELCREGGGAIQTGPFGSQLHASDYVMDGIPSVMPQNIGDNTISVTDIARISKADANRLKKYLLETDDIIYSRRGDVEKRAIIREENAGWLCGTGCLRVRLGPDSTTDARFVSYFLGMADSRAWIRMHAVGATMPNLNTKILSAFPIYLPSLDIQILIADLLSAIDDKISSNHKIVETSELLARATLGRSLQAQPQQVALGDVATVTRGITPSYSDDSSQLVVLNQKCIRDQRISLSPARTTVRDKVPKSKILLKDDVLVNSTGVGTLGRVARWTQSMEVTADSHVSIVRFDQSRIDATCAGFTMLTMQSAIELLGEGSTGQTELSRNQLEHMLIPRVDPGSEREVASKLSALSALASQRLEECWSLVRLRDILLPQLISGQLRVRDGEKQVENVL